MGNKTVNNSDYLVYDLMNAVRILTRTSLLYQNAVAAKMDLNVTDTECIDFLSEMGPSTAGDLARMTRLTTGAITNVIDRLEEAGYVKRERDKTDRRKVIVHIVQANHEKLKKHYESLAKDVFDLLSGYDKKNLQLLLKHTANLQAIYQHHASLINGESNDKSE
jgi:MarR family transcriptional regulator, organic hydroperoxide resistance regulator